MITNIPPEHLGTVLFYRTMKTESATLNVVDKHLFLVSFSFGLALVVVLAFLVLVLMNLEVFLEKLIMIYCLSSLLAKGINKNNLVQFIFYSVEMIFFKKKVKPTTGEVI